MNQALTTALLTDTNFPFDESRLNLGDMATDKLCIFIEGLQALLVIWHEKVDELGPITDQNYDEWVDIKVSMFYHGQTLKAAIKERDKRQQED